MITYKSSLHQWRVCVSACVGREVMVWKLILGDDESSNGCASLPLLLHHPSQHRQWPWAGTELSCCASPASFDALLHLSCSISNCLLAAFTGDIHRVDVFGTTFSRSVGISQRIKEMYFKPKLFLSKLFVVSCILLISTQNYKIVAVYSCVTHSQPGCLWLSFLEAWSRNGPLLIFLWTTEHRTPAGQDPWLKMEILYSSGQQQCQLEISWHTPRNTRAASSPAQLKAPSPSGLGLEVSALPPWHCLDRTGKNNSPHPCRGWICAVPEFHSG